MRYSQSKDVHSLVVRYLQLGWTFRRGKRHGLLSPPGCGLFVPIPSTPSDSRAVRNLACTLRRVAAKAGRPSPA